MKIKSYLILILSLISFSCKKPEDRQCYKGRGEDISTEMSIEGIESATLGRNIKFVLIQDSTEKVVVKTGKNLINFLKISFVNKHLEISNNNKCNYLRYNKNEVLVELHIKSIRRIYYKGSEPLTNVDTLSWGSFSLISNDNAAIIDLNVQMDSLYFSNPYAWPIVNLKGICNFCQINIEGDAKMNLRNLKVCNTFNYESESSQFGEINLQNTLKFVGQLRGNGDVGYRNDPIEIFTSNYGKGIFRKLN